MVTTFLDWAKGLFLSVSIDWTGLSSCVGELIGYFLIEQRRKLNGYFVKT